VTFMLGGLVALIAVNGLPFHVDFKSLQDLYTYMSDRGEEVPSNDEAKKKAAYAYIAARVNRKKYPEDKVLAMSEDEVIAIANKTLRHICWYRPMESWRRHILIGLQFVARSVLFFSGFIWIDVDGELAPREEAPILISNHVSMCEPAFMVSQCLPAPIAAAEHLKIPFLSQCVLAAQAVTVDRNSTVSRHEVREQIKSRAESKEGWPHILIYPEATCTNGKAVITFKTGAFAPGRPVQLCHVSYKGGRFNPSWVSNGPSLWHIVFRLMCEPINRMKVDFGPVYQPNQEEKDDELLYSRRVRENMAKWFGLLKTSHSYDDVRLQALASKMHAPLSNAVIGADSIRRFFNMKLDDIQAYYKKFQEIGPNQDGLLSQDQFLRGLGIEDPEKSAEWTRVFELLDEDGDGFIDFRVYLIGMAFANTELDNQDVLKAVHQIFDEDGDGYLTLQEFTSILHNACPSDELYTPRSIKEIFEEVDLNKDGKIAISEFTKYCAENPKLSESFQLWRKNFQIRPLPGVKASLAGASAVVGPTPSDFRAESKQAAVPGEAKAE